MFFVFFCIGQYVLCFGGSKFQDIFLFYKRASFLFLFFLYWAIHFLYCGPKFQDMFFIFNFMFFVFFWYFSVLGDPNFRIYVFIYCSICFQLLFFHFVLFFLHPKQTMYVDTYVYITMA